MFKELKQGKGKTLTLRENGWGGDQELRKQIVCIPIAMLRVA